MYVLAERHCAGRRAVWRRAAQDITQGLLSCPEGRAREAHGRRLLPRDAFVHIAPECLAAASIAQAHARA